MRFGHIVRRRPSDHVSDADFAMGLRSIQRFAGLQVTGTYRFEFPSLS